MILTDLDNIQYRYSMDQYLKFHLGKSLELATRGRQDHRWKMPILNRHFFWLFWPCENRHTGRKCRKEPMNQKLHWLATRGRQSNRLKTQTLNQDISGTAWPRVMKLCTHINLPTRNKFTSEPITSCSWIGGHFESFEKHIKSISS